MIRKKKMRRVFCALLTAGCLVGTAAQAGEVSLEGIEVIGGSRSTEAVSEVRIDDTEPAAQSETRTESEAGTASGTGTESEAGTTSGTGTESETGTVSGTSMASETGTTSETSMGSEAGTVSGTNTEFETETKSETESETETESPIDFEGLWEINTDIYAWIRIPGTVIDYPILQSMGEEDFYLTHDIEGNEDIYGSIYTQRYNEKDFSDFHTIIYGHNMRDDTMFGWLSELANLETLWDHDVIYIYLPDRTLEYWIFAAYVSDNMHQLGGVNTRSRADRQEYLDKVEARCADVQTFDRRLFDKVTADSHILTLSTCYQNDPEHRFLVQAVLVEQPDAGTLPVMEKPETLPEPEFEVEPESETETEFTPAELAEAETKVRRKSRGR